MITNDHRKEDSGFKCDTHALKRCVFEDWHNQKYGCYNSCADGKQDDIAQAHIQTAIHFVSDPSQHALFSLFIA